MHNEIFTIGPVTVYGYGLMIAIGIVLAYCLAEYRARKIPGLDDEKVFGLTCWAVVAGLIGGKLLYYITTFQEILADPSLLLDVVDGFVIYGALIGGVMGVVLYCKWQRLNVLSYFDLAVPSVALAQGFGRIGCLLAGCCYGRETHGALSIVFQASEYAPNGIPLIPTQIISSILNFIHFAVLIVFAKKYKKAEGQVAGLYFALYSAGRFVLEFFRGDMERGNVGALSTSQFIAIFMFVFGFALFFSLGKWGSRCHGAAAVSVIGGADGPTSIFLAGTTEEGRKERREKMKKRAGTITSKPHTLEEVEAYLKEKYQAELLPPDCFEVQEQEKALRAALVLKHKPEFLKTPEPEMPKSKKKAELERFFEQTEKRMKEAEQVTAEGMPLDFRLYRIVLGNESKAPKEGEDVLRSENCLDVIIEKNYQVLQTSYQFREKEMEKKINEICRDIYLYYGVTEEDKENLSERFMCLVHILDSYPDPSETLADFTEESQHE